MTEEDITKMSDRELLEYISLQLNRIGLVLNQQCERTIKIFEYLKSKGIN